MTGTKDLVPLICFPSGCLIQQIHSDYVNVAEGLTVTYRLRITTAFAMQASHSITNGGGLFGAVKFYMATADVLPADLIAPGRWLWRLLYAHSDSISRGCGGRLE